MSVPPTDLAATRAFFGPRAATWEIKFPDDAPRYRRAVADLAPPRGGAVADIACGTGRALPELREAVGPQGSVIGVDVTVQMIEEAARRGRDRAASLLLGDALHLPLATGSLDAVFAAGLVSHLPDPVAGLAELGRVCRTGGRLAVFHPLGRAALARRQGRELSPEDLRAEPNIRAALTAAGWHLDMLDDGEDRYLALAHLRG
ncbi:SAM-dependent methyltransferase [Amycolatopsis endophytica]|uniref:SAM-dependent methyltransferase n=1 Tax=Amycolatopsis endophytica TaxID=860233 RepID=A0A853B9L8_9PSEU|nr:methyltransferase domain-containing protein [Amycolatopsis endophytica]NYI91391.1 SAM-dependent methyltransferase [Amycolatopsis endophytica]